MRSETLPTRQARSFACVLGRNFCRAAQNYFLASIGLPIFNVPGSGVLCQKTSCLASTAVSLRSHSFIPPAVAAASRASKSKKLLSQPHAKVGVLADDAVQHRVLAHPIGAACRHRKCHNCRASKPNIGPPAAGPTLGTVSTALVHRMLSLAGPHLLAQRLDKDLELLIPTKSPNCCEATTTPTS